MYSTIPELEHMAILDCETGGLDHTCQPLLSVAVRRPEGPWAPDLREWLVRESESVLARAEQRALNVNGHCLNDIRANGLPPTRVAVELAEYLDALRDDDGRVWVLAHQATFDARWIDRLFGVGGVEKPRGTFWFCTASMAFGLRMARGRGPYSLKSLCRWYGVPHPEAHTAAGDVNALAGVLPCLLAEMAPPARSRAPRNPNQEELL